MSPSSPGPRAGSVARRADLLAATAARSVREERRRRGWPLRILAGRAGLSVAAVHRIESGAVGSLETYARLAAALGLRAELTLERTRSGGSTSRERANDPVHAAMVEAWADRLRGRAEVLVDEPYQHYRFAGRADLVAWSAESRALLHVEIRTAFPDLQDAIGRYNAKRAYLGAVLAERLGIRGGWTTETHALVALWSAEVIHVMRLRSATFQAVGPDEISNLGAWWDDDGGSRPGRLRRTSVVALFDPIAGSRSDRRRLVGLDRLDRIRPRHRDYADALRSLRRAGLA